MKFLRTLIGAAAIAATLPAVAQSVTGATFVNGFAIAGDSLDRSVGNDFDRRVGFFSDLYFDRSRNEWWGVSDRGPGGGALSYETRVQRFTLDVNPTSGAISNFQVAQTIKFTNAGAALNGLAPNPSGVLGNAFDPEGLVVNPVTGNLLVSDEYGPSVYEFNRSGVLVRQYTTPANLLPKVGSATDFITTPPSLTSGREPNRGFEGLAISPDGKYAYAMLQNGTIQDGWTSSGRGIYSRIVKFDTATGEAVAQYAYRLQSSSQGRGISAIVALGNDKFLVLERNNRGVGVAATVGSPDKNVFEIDLAGAVDVTNINLPASANFAGAVTKNTTAKIDLDANTLAALGNKSPEKWEGLAVGPQLSNGQYMLLAGTDNDYSVTQNGPLSEQFDVYFKFSANDPYAASIQCPKGSQADCVFTTGGAAATLDSSFSLLPGVLHAYKADITGYMAPVPEPQTWALLVGGLLAVSFAARRARPSRGRTD